MTPERLAFASAALGPRDATLDRILRASLLDHRMPTIQIDDNAGRVLQALTMLRRPRRAIELGTLFGYSTIFIARGMPEDGQLTTVEVDRRAAELARRNLAEAGLADRVEVVVGDAAQYLDSVPRESAGLIFIDADKESYPRYLGLCFPLLERGGLLVADDAFADGDFSVDGDHARATDAIRKYARAAGRSSQLFSCFLGTESGLMVSMKP
jgi:caffeoyl-CoA O-methyltransferase